MKVNFKWVSFLQNRRCIIAIKISSIPYFYVTTMYRYRQPKRQSPEEKPDTGPLITLNMLALRRILSHRVALQPLTTTMIIKLMKPVEKNPTKHKSKQKPPWRNFLRQEPRHLQEPQRKLCIKPGWQLKTAFTALIKGVWQQCLKLVSMKESIISFKHL